LSFGVAGGRVDASGSAHGAKAGNRVAAKIRLSDADIGGIAELAGAVTGQIAGKLDGAATVEMTGQTLADVVKQGRGRARSR